MHARLQQRATPSRVSPVHAKASPGKPSQFDRIRQLLDDHLAKAQEARKRLLEEPYDPKLLHAWRVGLRRVTATLKDVAGFSDDDLGDVLAYLRLCREATGSCRDLDILAQETLPAFLKHAGTKGALAEQAMRVVAGHQQEAHRQAVLALKKYSLAIPLQAWRHWVASLEPPADRTARNVAAAVIERRFDTLKKRVARLDGGQKRLHRLRSATKKLRYSIELYRYAFPKPSDAWLKQLAVLQGQLGLAHDRMMGRKLLSDMLGKEEARPFRRWSRHSAYEASKKAMQSLEKLQRLSRHWRAHAH